MTRTDALDQQARLFPPRRVKRQPALPEICLDVRQAMNGAADPWPADFLRKVQAMLEARMATWEWTNHPPSLEYAVDAAVFTMVGATVEMLAEYLKGTPT